MENLIHGLGDLGTASAIIYLLVGAFIGVVVGVIPGLGTPVVLSIILIFIEHVDLTGTLCLFLGAQCGSFYSASISAILLNTPSHPEAFPITLDGYPMARNGEPARALGISAASTAVGGFIGCAVLVAFLPILDKLPVLFHPPDYVALVTLAMLLVGTLHTDSIGKTFVSAGAGLFLASIGSSPVTGTERFVFNNPDLASGISLVAVVLGVFAVPQMVMLFGTASTSTNEDLSGNLLAPSSPVRITGDYGRQVARGVGDAFRHWAVLLQSGVVGGVTGMIPGIGGFTGNFMAYGIARQFSRKRDQFGTGIPEGIIAPEGSSLAKEAGHIVPIVGIGIPGGVAGALFIGALAIKNLKVGYGFQAAYPNVTGEMVWIIAITGLVGTLMGVLAGAQIAKVTMVPGPLLVPFIVAICVTGPFFTDRQFFAVMEMIVFSLIGLFFRRLGYPLGTFIMGLVLGSTFEININLTQNIYPNGSFLWHRPLADILIVISISVVVVKARELMLASRKKREVLMEAVAAAGESRTPAQIRREQRRNASRHPVLGLIVMAVMLAVGIGIVFYGWTHYVFATAVMPVIGGFCIAVPSALALPGEIDRFLYHLAVKRGSVPVLPELALAVAAPAVTVPTTINGTVVLPDEPSAADPGSGAGGDAAVADGPPPIVELSWGRHGQYRREAIGFLAVCAAILLSWLFNFAIGGAIFCLGFGLLATRRHFRSMWAMVLYSLLGAVATWVVLYEMFHLSFITFTPKIHF